LLENLYYLNYMYGPGRPPNALNQSEVSSIITGVSTFLLNLL